MAENPIDDYQLRLIADLMLEAGRIMEDVSSEFARRLPRSRDGVTERIALLEQSASDLTALAAAARAILRQSERSSSNNQ